MPDVGDIRTATLTVDPFDLTTAATLEVTAPDATTAAPAASTGDGGATWTATLTYAQSGWHLLKWTVTGTGAGIEYQQVYVSGAPVQPSVDPLVASLEDFKEWLRQSVGNANPRDGELLLALTSATEWVKWRLSGPLTVTTFTERIWANGYHLKQRKHPLVSVVSITPQDAGVLNSSAYIVDTTNSMIQMLYQAYGFHTVVYTAGLTTVTPRIKLAGMEVGRHLWRALNGSAGRGRGAEELVPTPMGFAVPARAEEMIAADPDQHMMPGFA